MASRGLDRPLLATTGMLAVSGAMILYSAGQTDMPTVAAGLWQRQIVWLAIGVTGAAVVYRISPRVLEWLTPFVYGLSLVLLGILLVAGTGAGTAASTKSWLTIGNMRVGQPAELAKLATILMLARHFGSRRDAPSTLWDLLPACIIVGIPFGLVALQPDLGSAIVFLGILFAVLYWVGVKARLLLFLASPIISLMMGFNFWTVGTWLLAFLLLLVWVRPYLLEGLVVGVANLGSIFLSLELWGRLAPYQQNRLVSFLNPEVDPRATGWHIIQSKVAIGSGALFGKGFEEGTQKRLAFLPAQHTDFIYSVIGEELGFLGVIATLVLFAALVVVLVRIARRATDSFSCVVVFGIAGMLFTHVIENIGMTVGLMPITGIPLPFYSYGGSFLLTCCLAIGLALRVAWEGRLAGYADI